MKYSKIIEDIYKQVLSEDNLGTAPTYIPELAQVDPNKFGVYLYSLNKQSYGVGDCEERFSSQSIAKVLSLCLAYSIIGDKLWKRVDVEPSVLRLTHWCSWRQIMVYRVIRSSMRGL